MRRIVAVMARVSLVVASVVASRSDSGSSSVSLLYVVAVGPIWGYRADAMGGSVCAHLHGLRSLCVPKCLSLVAFADEDAGE
jgi:hypothetical protein